MITIETKRLVLRPWRFSDFEPFAQLNADSRVMEYFPSTLSRAESDRMTHRMLANDKDWGLWAVSIPGIADFIGFIGLNEVTFTAPFTPAIEVGWRIAYEYWGNGYATEGALASLKYGFEALQLNEIVSFTTERNRRSRAVMERIGMHHDLHGDFDHPRISEESPIRRHVLYRLSAEEWNKPIFKIIGYGSREYHQAVSLREEILRKPLNLCFTLEELESEKEHIHIAALLHRELCGTSVLVPEGPACKMQRVAVRADLQNQGIGCKLVEFCEQYAREHGFSSIYCHARGTAIPFYLKNHYVLEGEPFMEDGIPHHQMRKKL
jgi:RimJ/RimL family protein N-acetyltransferase/predicted GNAT family N-acyltransferase